MTVPLTTIVLIGPPSAGASSFARAVAVDVGTTEAHPTLLVRARDAATRRRLHVDGQTPMPTQLALAVRLRSGALVHVDLVDLPGAAACAVAVAPNHDGATALPTVLSTCDVLLLLLPTPGPGEGPDRQALALLDGLATLLARRAERPAVAVVLSKADLLRADERGLSARALLAAHGYGAGLTELAHEAGPVEWFVASALGLEGDPDAPRPDGVAQPVVWALERVRSRRRRTLAATWVGRVLAAASLLALAAGLDVAHWLWSVAPPASSQPEALLEAAARATTYADRALALHAVDSRRRAAAWTAQADDVLWARVEPALAGDSENAAIQALDSYLCVLPAGERAESARALVDVRRLARLTRSAAATDLDGLLRVMTSERDRLHGDAPRRDADTLVAGLRERIEARDLLGTERAVAVGDPQVAIGWIDWFVRKHPGSLASPRLLGARDRFVAELDQGAWDALLAQLKAVQEPMARLVAVRRHLDAYPRNAATPPARELLARLEAEADDAAYVAASTLREPTTAGASAWCEDLERYLTGWPRGRHVADVQALLVEVRALEPALERAADKDPDGVLAALTRARGAARVTGDLVDRLARRWSVVNATVIVRTAHVRGSYWEVFSDPDPCVVLRLGGAVMRTRIADDERDAQYDERFSFQARPGASIRVELFDDEVFGETLVDGVAVGRLRDLDGTVALGGSVVVVTLESVEPAGP